MDDVVERAMTSYENHERQGREDTRVKVGQYLEKLASAGHRDVEELTDYGLAYLRMLHEGPDPRYSTEKIILDKRCCPEPCGTPPLSKHEQRREKVVQVSVSPHHLLYLHSRDSGKPVTRGVL